MNPFLLAEKNLLQTGMLYFQKVVSIPYTPLSHVGKNKGYWNHFCIGQHQLSVF